MRMIDKYLDKWISRKALAMLTHDFAVCGYKTITEEKKSVLRFRLKDTKGKMKSQNTF